MNHLGYRERLPLMVSLGLLMVLRGLLSTLVALRVVLPGPVSTLAGLALRGLEQVHFGLERRQRPIHLATRPRLLRATL
ncbi:MAG: hypothetical protein U1F42_09185 [Candidatus Competibacteraceae bacterium]